MIEDYLEGIIGELSVSPVVFSFTVVKREVGDEEGYIRIKCSLANGDFLEFAEYVEARKAGVYTETYSFHWQTSGKRLIKRWDNVKHHKEFGTFPYHLHLPDKQVMESKPMNVKKVLAEIEKALGISE